MNHPVDLETTRSRVWTIASIQLGGLLSVAILVAIGGNHEYLGGIQMGLLLLFVFTGLGAAMAVATWFEMRRDG